MEQSIIINELTYPIQPVWILSSIFTPLIPSLIFISIFLVPLFMSSGFTSESLTTPIFYIGIYLIGLFIRFFHLILTRANFHYSFEESLLTIKYGILSKKSRNLPYGVIQNIVVKQGVSDRIFGLASLKIENAASAGSQVFSGSKAANTMASRQADTIGSFGNQISIPGLKKEHAEYLKNVLYEKIKTHPTIEQGM